MHKSKKVVLATVLSAAAGSGPAVAVEFEWSGFASLVAGRTYGSCTPGNGLASAFSGSCTRFVADWAHARVYSDQLRVEPESRAGLQGTARFTPQVAFTAQVVGRLASDPFATVEAAYLSWQPAPQWTLQAGRKRLPFFYYSEVQDIGYAYPWVRVPGDVYGWDIANYDGASIAYAGTAGDWAVRSSLFGGSETSRKNDYSRLYYDVAKDVKWPRILGADLEVKRGWFTGRIVYMQSDYEQVDRDTGTPDVQPSGDTRSRHQAYGGSINIDYGNFIGRSEFSVFDRSRYSYKATSWFVSGGWRFGAFTPMLTFSNYSESTPYPASYDVAHWSSGALSLRYDFGKSSAVKLQVDRLLDKKALQPGTATLLSLSYDVTF